MPQQDSSSGELIDGDDWFLGFASRLDPGNLPEKMLQAAENIRLQRGTASCRLGALRISGTINATTPVVAQYGAYRHTGVYVDPNNGYEYILVVTEASISLLYQDGTLYRDIRFAQQTGGAVPDQNSNPIIFLGSEVQAIQALDKVYLLRGSSENDFAQITFTNSAIPNNTWGTFTVTNYQISRWTSKPFVSSGNNVVITIDRNHGFSVGDRLQTYAGSNNSFYPIVLVVSSTTETTISCNNISGLPVTTGTISFARYNDIFHNEFIIQVPDTAHDHFNGTYAVQNPTVNGMLSGTFTFQYFNNTGNNVSANTNHLAFILEAKSPIVWDGVSDYAYPVQQVNSMTGTTANVPPADFGIYFQNRLVLRIGNHYIAVSDILSDTFDMQLNNFNINVGSGDSIVGFLPWIENQFLVFMTKSIYVAYIETTSYISGPPGANSSITVVTNEIGCLARRTIVNAGQFVFFLSAKGVHMLTPQLDLKLIGNTVPLSEPVADFFEKLNYTKANHSCAVYFSNRFYITIPWNNSEYNNRTLVYNTLNQSWESIDIYQDDMYIDEYFICAYGNQRKLMAGCRIWSGNMQGDIVYPTLASGIALFDDVPGYDMFTLEGIPPTPFPSHIDGYIRTREYMFSSLSEKKFTRSQIQFNNTQNDRVRVVANTHDPDTTEELTDYIFELSQDSTIRSRIATRGTTIDLSLYILSGTPSIKTITVSAFGTDRKMISQE
jgi:hypothetical protein